MRRLTARERKVLHTLTATLYVTRLNEAMAVACLLTGDPHWPTGPAPTYAQLLGTE